MTNVDLLPATVLRRKAVVYVRQSTQAQVDTNLESQRRHYDLVNEARRHGFQNVEVNHAVRTRGRPRDCSVHVVALRFWIAFGDDQAAC
jgi:hypothetical protein